MEIMGQWGEQVAASVVPPSVKGVALVTQVHPIKRTRGARRRHDAPLPHVHRAGRYNGIMHIRRIEIENIRVIKHLIWELPEEQKGAGWHVILGDNGSGKTSFIRSVGYSLLSPSERSRLPMSGFQLRNKKSPQSKIVIRIEANQKYDSYEHFSEEGQTFESQISISSEVEFFLFFHDLKESPPVPIWKENNDTTRIKGWFSISFGPERRFASASSFQNSVLEDYPQVHRHAPAFSESISLTKPLPWLQLLRFEQLEKQSNSAKILEYVLKFVNQTEFLAHDTKIIEVTSKEVVIEDANGNRVSAEEMSDGYRSVLSLTFELIRQLVDCFGVDKVFDPEDATRIIAPGVVQIDEVDAHLHPTWQHRIGDWFTTHFPNIQFIVTTHSPIICQAADTVFKLPTPGTDEVGEFVTGNALLRLKYGSVSEAYGTGVFGVGVERSEEAKGLMDELAALNIKELDNDLTDDEIERQEFLRGLFPSNASVGLPRRRAQ